MLTFIFKTLSIVPLGCWLRISPALAWVMGSVAKYRRKVVISNLSGAFPEKTPAEINRIADDFYRFLTDYLFETLSLATMKPDEMRRRMKFRNMDLAEKVLARGGHVSLFLGHYCNWEWCSSIPLNISTPCRAMEVYHPLENTDADKAFLMLRSRFGAIPVPMADTLRAVFGARRDGVPGIMGYIADQTPLYESTHLFLDFLNHDTPVLTGAEKISRKLKAAAFYCDMHRIAPGRYECELIPLADDASTLPDFELTKRYFSHLEASIRRQPHLWLWSHRRWKRTRQGFLEAYGSEEAAKRLSHL